MLRSLASVLALALTLAACSTEVLQEEQGSDSSELANASCSGLKGVDVSDHNVTVDWNKVKASGRVYAFARVTEGLTQIDEQFAINWPKMKSVGLVRGTYQYFRARHDGPEQADVMFAELAANGGLKKGDFLPVVDIETNDGQSNATLVARTQRWLDYVEARIGAKPIVYTGNNMNDAIGLAFKSYPLWIAHYEVPCPRLPDAWTKWQFWQDGEQGTVPGITQGGVDTDFFNGTRSELDAMTLDHDVDLSSLL